MLEIKGKVNTAICYAKIIEDEAINQIRRMCDYDMAAGSKIRIAFYDEQYAECTAHLDMQKLYDRFEKYLPEGASVLDAGCGSGRDSKHFIEKGYTVTAFDASGIMCEYASMLTGQEVRKLTFQEMDYQDCFDGICGIYPGGLLEKVS